MQGELLRQAPKHDDGTLRPAHTLWAVLMDFHPLYNYDYVLL
jgi:hypothetical protein